MVFVRINELVFNLENTEDLNIDVAYIDTEIRFLYPLKTPEADKLLDIPTGTALTQFVIREDVNPAITFSSAQIFEHTVITENNIWRRWRKDGKVRIIVKASGAMQNGQPL